MKVVHCKTAPAGSFVYIGRPSILGNPFTITAKTPRELVIAQYKTYFRLRINEPEFRAAVEAVRGQDLGCWCAPKACHGDVILEWLEGR